MPGTNDASAAARFVITFEGNAVGRFETLFAATAPGAAARALQVHELPQLWQHAYEFRPAKFSQTDHKFELPSESLRQRPTVILKRGTGRRASLARWQALGRRSVALVGLSPTGQPMVRCRLSDAWVIKITGPTFDAKGGSDVAMEEIAIGYERMSLS